MKPKYTQIGNVILVGTSHIAKESVDNVALVVEQFAPCIVGVELDKGRFYGLVHDQKKTTLFSWENIRQFGVKGFVFAVIASTFTERLAKMVGAKPGEDMLSTIRTAKKKDLTIALLDQPIQITLRRFSQEITWKEKWRFVVDVFAGFLFPTQQAKKYGLENMDLRKVPQNELISKMLFHVRKRYPNVYKVLIEERNLYMVRKIRLFQEKHPGLPIVVVIGAGHEEGMRGLLMRHQ